MGPVRTTKTTQRQRPDPLLLQQLSLLDHPPFLTQYPHYILPKPPNPTPSQTENDDPPCVLVYIPQYLSLDIADGLFHRFQSSIAWNIGPPIIMWGKSYPQPRMIAFYGDAQSHPQPSQAPDLESTGSGLIRPPEKGILAMSGRQAHYRLAPAKVTHTYSKLEWKALDWIKEKDSLPTSSSDNEEKSIQSLYDLRGALFQSTGLRFNAVLCNQYRDGKDHISFHSDNEKDLGLFPVIASLSLGATRVFVLKQNIKGSKPLSQVKKLQIPLEHGSLCIMYGSTQRYYQHAITKKSNSGPRINLTFRQIFENS